MIKSERSDALDIKTDNKTARNMRLFVMENRYVF